MIQPSLSFQSLSSHLEEEGDYDQVSLQVTIESRDKTHITKVLVRREEYLVDLLHTLKLQDLIKSEDFPSIEIHYKKKPVSLYSSFAEYSNLDLFVIKFKGGVKYPFFQTQSKKFSLLPSYSSLKAMGTEGLKAVDNLVLRNEFGEIRIVSPLDLRFLNIDKVFDLQKKKASIKLLLLPPLKI